MNLRYVNSRGVEINLNDGAYLTNANDLRNYSWKYATVDYPSGLGSAVRAFAKPAMEKTLNLGVRGTKQQFAQRMDALLAITEPDIVARTPGKLWLGDAYLLCYLAVSSDVALYSRLGNFAEKALKVLAVSPFWYVEESKLFMAGSGEVSASGKRYNGRYPYQYGTGYANSRLLNTHYLPTPVVITIYGPCANPAIFISGIKYGVEASATARERIVIDQLERKIYKVQTNGGRQNLFGSRWKDDDPYTPVPIGESQVLSSGEFAFELTLCKQRSEPKWI